MKIYSNFFSYIPFWHQKYITAHLKPNLIASEAQIREANLRARSIVENR